MSAIPTSRIGRRTLAGWLAIGFALGGFFDGILLHQILQWHHLLSGLSDPNGSDMTFQIMADGLFHLLMYVVAVVGVCLILTGRPADRPGPATWQILRLTLIGFAAWHITDAVLSHWLLGIHRIKMDSAAPLAWDVAWLVVFGLVPIALVLLLPRGGAPGSRAGAAVLTLTLAAGLAAGSAPLTADADETTVIFPADLDPARKMDAVLAAGSALRWSDASGAVWVVDRVGVRDLRPLFAGGAVMVSNAPLAGGCLAWTDSDR